MKKSDKILAIVSVLILVGISFFIGYSVRQGMCNHTYQRAAYVTEVRESQELVVCEDAVGFMWTFYGIEDFEVGDLVILSMNDNKTSDSILDDRVEGAVYAGFWR